MIQIHDLEVHYGSKRALAIHQPVTVHAGDHVGIIGSNGAGKSTLINALLGLVPAQGHFKIALPLEHISVHLQSNHYNENVSVRMLIETISGAPIKAQPKLAELIHYFDFEPCLKQRFQKLSGGQQQRLTLILVLAQENPLIFLDEVTSGLDFETRQRLMDLLSNWFKENHSTLCIVSHYYEELEKLTNKILYLEEGEIVDFGNRQELFEKYCGRTVIICPNTEEHRTATADFIHLAAPEHLIAIKCPESETEAALTARLAQHNLDYKRSSSDIEIMSVNAKQAWLKAKELRKIS